MDRSIIIAAIERKRKRLDEATNRRARFRHDPLRTLWFYGRVAWNRYLPLRLPLRAATVWGDRVTAYETSAIGSVYFLGFYDIDTTLFLLKHFHESGDILDIGSNIGYYALLGAQVAGPNTKVVAFEPTPATFKLLTENTRSNSRIAIEQRALADRAGEMTFIDYGDRNAVFNSTKAQVHDFLQGTGIPIKVATTTLDAYSAEHDLAPALIKLDTEGTEAGILAHGTRTLREHAPLILLEVGGGEAWRDNTTKSLDILADAGYGFFELDDAGTPHPHVRQASYAYQNLVCIPERKQAAYVHDR